MPPQENIPQGPKSIFKPAIPLSRTKHDKHADRLAKFASDMSGDGQFIFENNTKGDLHLPRATKTGRKIVRKGEQFIGDSYYMQLVKSHELRFIKELIPVGVVNEDVIVTSAPDKKLITEQPPTFTNEGQVEYVTGDQPKLNEGERVKSSDVLLNEGPIDGITFLS